MNIESFNSYERKRAQAEKKNRYIRNALCATAYGVVFGIVSCLPLIHTSSAVSEVEDGGNVSSAAFKATREAIQDDALFKKVSSESIQKQSAAEDHLLSKSRSGTVERGDKVYADVSKSFGCNLLGANSPLCNVSVGIYAEKNTKK